MNGVIFLLVGWGSDKSVVVPLVVALLGVGGSIAASFMGGAFSSWFSRQQERQALAAAFAGEIQGIVKGRFSKARKDIAEGKAIPVDEDPFPIFEANVGKIGLLPVDLAGKVAAFYSDLKALFVDFRTLWTLLIEKKEPVPNITEVRGEILKMLDAMPDGAKALVTELREEASRPWSYYVNPDR